MSSRRSLEQTVLVVLQHSSPHSDSVYVGHLRHDLLPTTLPQAAVCNNPHIADNIRLSPGVYRMLIPKGQI